MFAGGLGGVGDSFRIGIASSQWLLTEDVFACLEGRDGHRPVEVVNADVDGVNARLREHFAEIGVDLGHVVFFGESVGSVLVDVRDGGDRRAGNVRVRLAVRFAAIACVDKSDSTSSMCSERACAREVGLRVGPDDEYVERSR